MRKKKLIPALALTLALLCGITIGAGASNGVQVIQAKLDSTISVKLNGETQILTDANGNRVFPISYNGTTYLPVRAVSNMLGIGVDWDGDTRSVLLGKVAGGVDLIEKYEIYHKVVGNNCRVGQTRTADNQTANISGVTKDHWLRMIRQWYGEAAASYNLQGKHDTLTFSYYADSNIILKITGDDGSLLGEYTITGGAVAKTVTVPLFKTQELKFELVPVVEYERTSPTVYIFDAYLDAE